MRSIVYDNTNGKTVRQILEDNYEELRERAIVLKYCPDCNRYIKLINVFDMPEIIVVEESPLKEIYTESINKNGDEVLGRITKRFFGTDFEEKSYEDYFLFKQRSSILVMIEKKTSEFAKIIKRQLSDYDSRLESESKHIAVAVFSRKLIG